MRVHCESKSLPFSVTGSVMCTILFAGCMTLPPSASFDLEDLHLGQNVLIG